MIAGRLIPVMIMRLAMTIALACSGMSAPYAVSAADQWFPHEVIRISCDEDFTTTNGVVSGTGTAKEPYLIEGWSIATGKATGLRIQGTSAHFVIRNCMFIGEGQKGIGIVLGESSSAQATIEQSAFKGLQTGVFAYRSAGASIQSNSFVECRRGIDGSEARNLLICGNSFSLVRGYAIFLWRCHDGTLEANHVSEGSDGFYLDSCHQAVLSGNSAAGMQHGIFLWDSFDCVVAENSILNCDLGVALVHTSAGNAIFHNSFVGNSRPATCDNAENRWDNGYPSGGNYWGDDGLLDTRSGPSQDLLGSDGIADTAQPIPFAGIDRYPLFASPVEGSHD